MNNLSPTIPLVRSLSQRARTSPKALADLRQIAAGQAVRRDLHKVLASQHVLTRREKGAEKKYRFSLHDTQKRIGKAPQGSRAVRRLAEREVARHDQRVKTETMRRGLFAKLLVQTADEPPITLTPEDAAEQTRILCKLGRTPSPKVPLTKPRERSPLPESVLRPNYPCQPA